MTQATSIRPTSIKPTKIRKIGIFLGPVFLLATLILPVPEGMPPEAWRAIGMSGFIVIWWMTEAVPLPVTSLLPIALIPLLGLGNIKHAVAPYASPMIFLYMGGFIIAIAIEKWQLHRRIALNIIKMVGVISKTPAAIIAGFMLATALLSMFISNTATTLMMLPIALSVIKFMNHSPNDVADEELNVGKDLMPFAVALMLSIAYSASIGGIGTIIGTPPNIVLKGFMEATYDIEISVIQWSMIGIPISITMLIITWLILTKVIYRGINKIDGGKESYFEIKHKIIDDELEKLGKISKGEFRIIIIGILTMLGWILREKINNYILSELPFPVYLSDAGIAIIAALAIFLTPINFRKGEYMLSWPEAEKLPWGILLLFGGGLSMAATLSVTGFAGWVGNEISSLNDIPSYVYVIVTVAAIIFLTELMSNTATISAFLPVLAAVAYGIGENPLFLLVPATIAASCAFMMPTATPPNAVVFSCKFLTVPQMVKSGFLLNIIAIFVVIAFSYGLAFYAFDISMVH